MHAVWVVSIVSQHLTHTLTYTHHTHSHSLSTLHYRTSPTHSVHHPHSHTLLPPTLTPSTSHTPSQVHTECRDQMEPVCTLGEHRLSILPPSALQRSNAIREGMWEVSQHHDCCVDHIKGFYKPTMTSIYHIKGFH